MKSIGFWWRRRRGGLPVRLGDRSSGIVAYSCMALLAENDRS